MGRHLVFNGQDTVGERRVGFKGRQAIKDSFEALHELVSKLVYLVTSLNLGRGQLRRDLALDG